MKNSKVEMFMSEYFLFKVILGKALPDSKSLFAILAEICLIHNDEKDGLYALAENEAVRQINTDADFMRYKRIHKYSKLIGEEQNIDEDCKEVVEIKGNAVLNAKRHKILSESETLKSNVYNNLLTAAANGSLVAMRIMGVLQCEGIFFEKNPKEGAKNLSKAADWNDCLSILALLHYKKDAKEYNMNRLRQITEGTPMSEIYSEAVNIYGETDVKTVAESKLLQKAFSSGVLSPEQIEPKCLRILCGKSISFKDKKKILLSKNKDCISMVSDLPVKLSGEKITAVDVEEISKILPSADQTKTIVESLQNCAMRGTESYRPLCICSDSKYILNMYAKALSIGGNGVSAQKIEVSDLNDYDLELSFNNVILRNIEEDKDNRFLFFFSGDIHAKKAEAVTYFLKTSSRAKFHLINPNVTLDLSAILPVCFCDKRNLSVLKKFCDVVEIPSLKIEEKTSVIERILTEKKSIYGVSEINLDEEAMTLLLKGEVDGAEKILDDAVRTERKQGKPLSLTKTVLAKFVQKKGCPCMGFGGSINEKND